MAKILLDRRTVIQVSCILCSAPTLNSYGVERQNGGLKYTYPICDSCVEQIYSLMVEAAKEAPNETKSISN